MVYALQIFWHYLLGGHFKMYTDHLALEYLVNKPVLGRKIYRWLLLFQEFDFEVIVKTGWLNIEPYHLSRIENGEEPTSLEDTLPNAQLVAIHMMDDQNIEFNATIHLLNIGYAPEGLSTKQNKHLVVRATNYTFIVGHLYKLGVDEILHQCVFDSKRPWVWVKHMPVS